MKIAFVFLALMCVLAPAAFAATTFSLTGEVAESFSTLPTAAQAVDYFAFNPPLWGMGWEVVLRKIGFGATYMVKFSQDVPTDWMLDWYGQALYISYHFFGGSAFFDPFIQTGLGCAGRVALAQRITIDRYGYPSFQMPSISLFPVLTAGLAFHLEAFTLGAKFAFIPFQAGIPVAPIPAYPVGSFQVGIFAGVTLGR